MDVAVVLIGYALLVLLSIFLCFSEFYKIRYLYKKAYSKKLLYRQYLKALKAIKNNKIDEVLYHCNIEGSS